MSEPVPGSLLDDPVLLQAVGLLASWLPDQRWFAGVQPPPARDIRIAAGTVVHEANPRTYHLLVDVSHAVNREVYQVMLAIHDEAEPRLEHVRLGTVDLGDGRHGHVYDALHDKTATADVLDLFVGADGPDGREVGVLRFRAEPDAAIPTGETSLVMQVEQSNTSLAFGDAALLKVFRRIRPGANPDVEIHHALTRAGSEYIAPLLGWIEGSWASTHGDTEHGDLAMLQTFLTTAADGWALAAASVRDLFAEGDLHADEVGGDFAGESGRLGAATALVHQTMADTLDTSEFVRSDLHALAARMEQRLGLAVEAVPELLPYADRLRARLEAVRAVSAPIPVQRIHGDYHLGQVLRTAEGWRLVDFEGEPGKPIAERVALDSPLRDVAGMLRSFDYAARHQLVTDHPPDDPAHEMIAYRAAEWAERNRSAFCDGYAKEADFDPRDHAVLLNAYETDKAVYEVVYESNHRPAWIAVPMAAIERLAQGT